MKKKKVRLILTLILVLILSGYILPNAIVDNFTKVTLINPYTIEVTQDIYITGQVKETDVSEVVTSLPLVPNKVLVKVGDTVEINQTLATVDKYATQEAIMTLINNIIQASEYLPNISNYIEMYDNILQNIEFDVENEFYNPVQAVSTTTIPTTISSSAQGVVTSLDLVKGSMTTPQAVVCTISKTDELYVEIQISEENINQIEVGDTVVFKAVATEGEMYKGTITTIYPTATKVYQGTTQKTIVGAYVEIEEKYENLKPEYNITGVVKDREKETVLILPYETVLQDENNEEYVYVYEENRAVKQIITTGKELSQGVEILTGVTPNTVVIYNANEVATEGSIVLG